MPNFWIRFSPRIQEAKSKKIIWRVNNIYNRTKMNTRFKEILFIFAVLHDFEFQFSNDL
jgi:hypothetical protein